MTYSSSQWRPTSTYDSDTFSYDGLRWGVSAEKSHSFSSPDNNTFRFEVRKGDQYSSAHHTDPQGTERAEMGEADRHSISGDGKHFVGEYKFMIEPGAKNTADWLVMGQLHSGLSRTPPFEIKFIGDDKMQVIAKYDNSDGRPVSVVLFKDTQDIKRGHWYTMKIDVLLDAKGGGHAHVWRDGKEIVDYDGKIGYTDQPTAHWKMGIYRGSPSGGETMAVQYKDIDLTYGTSAHTENGGPVTAPTPEAVPAPTPVPMPVPTPVPTPGSSPAQPTVIIKGTSGNDRLTGTSASEMIYGNSGNDKLNGKAGNDILSGGSGKDAFVFDTALSKSSNIDVIADFNVSDDVIHIDNAVFTEVGSWGAMKSNAFCIGAKARDSSDRIIYDKATGSLSYDSDGTGKADAVQFAKLDANLKLSAAHFIIL
jgi:hypothetical protein